MSTLNAGGASFESPRPTAAWRTVLEQREASLAGVLIGLLVLFSVLSNRFATTANLRQIATDMSIVAIVAVGQALRSESVV